MNKKRIFGIVLFLLIGFFMFTFANPNEEINDEDKKPKTEEKAKKEKKGIQVIEPVEVDNSSNIDTSIVRVNTNRVVPTENNIVNVQPIDNSKEIEANLKLEAAKKAAIEELVNYKKDYDYTDSSLREEIVKEYTDAINEAKDVIDVDRLLKDAEAKIDELVEEDFNKYVEEAINEVKEYADEYLEVKHEDKLEELTSDIKTSTTKDEVDEKVDNAKAIIDELKKHDLINAKEKAIEALKEYRSEYEYLEENKVKYDRIIEESINNINESSTIDDVNTALDNGKKEVDELIEKDIADRTLIDAKDNATEVITNYKNDEITLDENKAAREEIVNDTTQKINDAETVEDVTKALEDGKDAIDKLVQKDLEDVKAKELQDAKDKAIEEITNYKKDEIALDENKAAREEIVNDTINNINSAKTIEDVQNALTEGENKINPIVLKDEKERASEEISNYGKEEISNEEIQLKREDVVIVTKEDINASENNESVEEALQSGKTSIDELIVADQKISKISGKIDSPWYSWNTYITFTGVDSDVVISKTITTSNNKTIKLTPIHGENNKYELDEDIKAGTVIYITYTINGKEYKIQYTVTKA